MPIEVRIDPAAGLVRRTLTGRVSAGELIAELESTLRHPEYVPGMHSLTDLRANQHQASSQDMRTIANWFLGHDDAIRGGKAAIVVSQTVSYGMMRVLQTYLDDAAVGIGIFYDMAEAEEWLGQRPSGG